MTITEQRQAVEVRPRMTIEAREVPPAGLGDAEVVFDVQAFSAYYGSFRALTSAAIIVLLAVTLIANAFAIFLRNRYDRKW